jgi:hypothetical protein
MDECEIISTPIRQTISEPVGISPSTWFLAKAALARKADNVWGTSEFH